MWFLGVDCGASNLRVGLVDDNGEVLGFEKITSPLRHQSDQFGQKVKDLATKILNDQKLVESNIDGIGIGTPGPINDGQILKSSNIGNQEPINLRHQIELLFNSKVYFDLDGHVALRGEAWVGAASDSQDVVFLTLGTGVGGAIMDKGVIEEGSEGMAGELGHTYIATGDTEYKTEELPVCGLGHKGCLEGYIKHAKDLDQIGYYLGIALANFVAIFNPQKIIIGGGMIKQGDFLPKAIDVMKQKGMHPEVDNVIVQYGQLGDLAGVIGAAKMALDATNRK
jgi:glucokinase